MAGKREKPEEILSKLRQGEVLQGHGVTIAEAVRQIGLTQQMSYPWRNAKVSTGQVKSAGERKSASSAGSFGPDVGQTHFDRGGKG